MGLDITAYSNLELAAGDVDPNDTEDSVVSFYVNPDFPRRAGDIVDDQAYQFKNEEDFYAGSYGGYNQWRETLAEIAGYPKGQTENGVESYAATVWRDPKPGPFMELINFSDCEGVIGTEISTKLAKDFAEYQDKADDQDEFFKKKYALWRSAFEMASKNGAVKFW
ncbi:MAG: hypothetical protein JAY90_20335 [Candidatus Thiodiazotropha lotti]|nr:hypothetical protein [Candidatus Thiodiazotropha lotti]